MQGKIKIYNENRAFGFIIGEDGSDYFFHISEWKSTSAILSGTVVAFTPSESNRGKAAKNITFVASQATRPIFVLFGHERIKLSNIKNYGISSGAAYFVKVYELRDSVIYGLFNTISIKANCLTWTRNDLQVREEDWGIHQIKLYNEDLKQFQTYNKKFIRDKNGVVRMINKSDGIIRNSKGTVIGGRGNWLTGDPGLLLCENDVYKEYQDYLYLTTYQNSNYQWYKGLASFDIYEKCKELDRYLGI